MINLRDYTKYGLLQETNRMREMMGLKPLVEQEKTKVKQKGEGTITVSPKGDNDWVVKVPKKQEVDRDNITTDDLIFAAIKTGLKDKYPNLKPEQIQLSKRGKGLGRDKYIMMISADNATEEEKEEIKAVATKEVAKLPAEETASTEQGVAVEEPTQTKPENVRNFQRFVITKMEDKTILGGGGQSGYGDDGSWGPKTKKAWEKYKDQYDSTVKEKSLETKPDDIEHFQKFVYHTKGDTSILGSSTNHPDGIDGKWGTNTRKAWKKYGKDYKPDVDVSVEQRNQPKNEIWNVNGKDRSISGKLLWKDGKKLSYEEREKVVNRIASAESGSIQNYVFYKADGGTPKDEVASIEQVETKVDPLANCNAECQKEMKSYLQGGGATELNPNGIYGINGKNHRLAITKKYFGDDVEKWKPVAAAMKVQLKL